MLTEEDKREIKRFEFYSALVSIGVLLFSSIGLVISLKKFWDDYIWIWISIEFAKWGFDLSLIILGWLIWGGMIWLTRKASDNYKNYLITCNELHLLREELYKLKSKE